MSKLPYDFIDDLKMEILRPREVNRMPPCWACQRWGQYEHDWLDCPECIEAYEKWVTEEKDEM